MSDNFTPLSQLIVAIHQLGSISISSAPDKVAPGQRAVVLEHGSLYLGIPKECSPEEQVMIKEQMLSSIQGLENLHQLSRKYSLLKRNFNSIVESNSLDKYDQSLATNLLLFLGDTEQFGLLHDDQVVMQQDLSEHTARVAYLQLQKQPDYSVPVASGELYATHYQGFSVIAQRATPFSDTEKTHIKLTLKYISLQHIQNTLNEAMRMLLEADQQADSRLSHLRGSNLHQCLDFLVKDATLDPLTLTYNRRYALRYIENLYTEQTPFSLIMVDIDYFKLVNDLHGHEIGDRVLCHFSALFQSHCREEDVIARWGGEEFLIVLEGTALPDAVNKAERLRQLVEQHDFRPSHPLTASFGVTASSADTQEFSSLLRQADKALYQAKHGGRNQVITVTAE